MNEREATLLAAIRRAAEAGEVCPSNAALAQLLGYAGKQGVVQALRRLCEVGQIVVETGVNARVVAAADGSWRTAGDTALRRFTRPPEGEVKTPGDPSLGEWHTPQADASLARLWARENPQLSTRAMAAMFGVTKNAVIGRAHRLGLPGRPSPILRRAEGEAPARPQPPRAGRTTLPRPEAAPAPAMRVPAAPVPLRVPVARQVAPRPAPAALRGGRLARITAGTVAYKTCQWPQWPHDAARPPMPGSPGMFCDKPTNGIGPYCARCTPKAWSPAMQKAAA